MVKLYVNITSFQTVIQASNGKHLTIKTWSKP